MWWFVWVSWWNLIWFTKCHLVADSLLLTLITQESATKPILKTTLGSIHIWSQFFLLVCRSSCIWFWLLLFSTLLLYFLYTGPSTTIYWVDARHPGSVNDNYVLRNSSLYAKYNRGELPFEGAKVLGDMGYESFCPWLLTPFTGKYISTTSYLSILPVTHSWKKHI